MSTFTDTLQSSYSTPLHSTIPTDSQRGRPRRHTLTRPDSAMAFLSDMEENDEEDAEEAEQQQAFDRISSILSSLIQEANDAVHDIEEERVHLLSTTNSRKQCTINHNKNTTMCRKKKKHQRVYPSLSNLTNSSSPSQQQQQSTNVPSSRGLEERASNENLQTTSSKRKKKLTLPHPMLTDTFTTASPEAKWSLNYTNGSSSVPSPPYSPVKSTPPIIPTTSISTSTIVPGRTASSSLLIYPTKKRQFFRYTSQSRSASQLMAGPSSTRRSITVKTPKSNTLHSKRRLSSSTLNHGYLNSSSGNRGSESNGRVTADDILQESFKRLDSSMALIDSLSKDLAGTQSTDLSVNVSSRSSSSKSLFRTSTQHTPIFTIDATRLTVLLLVPLLHIPHSLITMMFDFCFYYSHSPTSSSPSSSAMRSHLHQQQQQSGSSFNSSPFNFSSMILWACVFAVTNFMVDQVAVTNPSSAITNNTIISRVRRLSATLLPGTFEADAKAEQEEDETNLKHRGKIASSSSSNEKQRPWLSSTQQQLITKNATQGEQSNNLLPVRKRRNSI